MKNRNTTPEINYRSKTISNHCIINCLNYISKLDDEKLLSMRYVIPFSSTKNSITELTIIDNQDKTSTNTEKVLTLQSEEIIIFQDELGNYIQIESYNKDSLILRFIISQNIPDSFDRIKYLFHSLESFLKVSNYHIPPLYVRLTDKVDFGYNEGRKFENKLNFLVNEFGFVNQVTDEETSLLVRTRRKNPIQDLNISIPPQIDNSFKPYYEID